MNGYESLLAEYSARASSLGVAVRESDAKRYFDYGLENGMSADFDRMEAAGITFPQVQFTPEEKKEAGTRNIGAKCEGPDGTELLSGLPAGDSGYTACWQRHSGRVKGDAYTIVIYSPVFQHDKWVQAQWLEGSGRWSPWTDEQQAAAATAFMDKHYGPDAVARERVESEKIAADIARNVSGGIDRSSELASSYKIRLQREGMLAGIDLIRRRAFGR